MTKKKMIDYLLRYGIPEDRIFVPNEEQIRDAPDDLKDALAKLVRVPYAFKTDDGGEVTLESTLFCGEEWVQVKLLLVRGTDIRPQEEERLYELVLQANYDLREVTYSLSPGGDLCVEADFPSSSTFENFQSEYGSVEFGLKYLVTDILPKLKGSAQIKSTFDESKAFYT